MGMLIVGAGRCAASEMRMEADPAVLQAMVKSPDTTSAQLENRNKAIKKCTFCIDETIQSC